MSPCLRGFPFSSHFRLVHQGENAPSGYGKVSELGEIGQGGSQRVEHTGADHEEQHKHKDGKLSSQQEIRSAQHHQSQSGPHQCNAQQHERTQQSLLTDAGAAQFRKSIAQADKAVAQQVVSFITRMPCRYSSKRFPALILACICLPLNFFCTLVLIHRTSRQPAVRRTWQRPSASRSIPARGMPARA